MSMQLREMFDQAADDTLPPDVTARAVRSATRRRRARWAIGGSVVATAAVVLGVAVAVNDPLQNESPRPTDVAAVPNELPKVESLPLLEAGSMQAASVAYVVDGELVFVSASTGDAFRYPTGMPQDSGSVEDIFIPALDVALSPDGAHALVTVSGQSQMAEPTVRLLDVRQASERTLDGLTPTDDAGGVTVARPNTLAWADDSRTFYCACYGPEVQGLWTGVVADAGQATLSAPQSNVVPMQVAAGSSGISVQLGEREPWTMPASDVDAHASLTDGYALALSRGGDPTYLAASGSGVTVGGVDGAQTTSVDLPVAPGDGEYEIVTDVDAVMGGFVVVVATAQRGEGFDHPSDAISSISAFFIGDDGAWHDLTSLPAGAVTASFASDVVSP
jgi:hypothetical protein